MQTEKVVNFIVNWLKDYAQKAGVKGFVIGVSGGIDSAVTSTLCALTNLDVYCLEMPIHQAESHVNRAKEHIKQLQNNYLNVYSKTINLTPVFDTFKNEVTPADNPEITNLALANTRARLRMTTLYYYAGLNNALVVGTGNKVEDFGIGFFTKYGDGGVDLSPIADLYKSDVYKIGRFLNVPESILTAAPSDGLFGDARSDETQIGATYPELEWAMEMDAKGFSASHFKDREHVVFNIYKKRNMANAHKIKPIPICKIPEKLK